MKFNGVCALLQVASFSCWLYTYQEVLTKCEWQEISLFHLHIPTALILISLLYVLLHYSAQLGKPIAVGSHLSR